MQNRSREKGILQGITLSLVPTILYVFDALVYGDPVTEVKYILFFQENNA